MAFDNSDNHKDQQLGQHIHFSPPKTPHSPKKPSPLRQCQRLSSIPDYDQINNLSLHDDDSATYLQDLRNNRVARLNGSRPPPPSRIASKRQQQRPNSSDDSIPTITNNLASTTTHTRQKSLDSHKRGDFAGRPLVAQPGPSNAARPLSLASQPLHEAIEELNLDEEQRIHAAAQDEAAELVWKHRTGYDPEKERASAYANPDVDPKAARKDYRTHLRNTSKDKIENHPLSVNRSVASNSPISSPQRPRTGALPDDPFVETTPVSTPTSTPRSTRAKGKSYEGLANAVANDVAISKRRVSSGSKRRPSADIKAGFMSPTDKIYEEPDEQLKEASAAELQKATVKAETKSEDVPRHVRRNPFARVRLAQEKFEKKESPSGYSVKKNDEKQSISGYTAKRHERIEIQRNPPSQSRNAFYTVNDSVPASPNLPPQNMSEKAVEDSPKMKDGKEIRSDDIRSATAMKRKDRSPNLPQPTAVSDSPGRPIVSFQSGWKQKEIQLVEEKSTGLPECLAVGKNAPSDAALSGKQRRYSLPRSQQGPPPIPTIMTPDEPVTRSPELPDAMPTISVMSADIPMIVVPDDPISSPSKTLSEEPDIPGISLSSVTSKPPKFAINEPSSVKNDRPPPLQHRPQSSPPKTSSPFSKRPLPTPTPSSARPLPVPSKTSPFPAVNKPHMTPSVRRNTALCAHCALPIAGRILSAAGERFHPSCFKCHECGINLECVAFYPEPDKKRAERLARIQQRQQGIDVHLPEGVTEEDVRRLEEEDGDESLRFFCGLDFHEFFSPRCKSCKTPIEGEVVVACGAEWHVGHFFCAQCGDPFDSTTPFVEKDGYACIDCMLSATSPLTPFASPHRRSRSEEHVPSDLGRSGQSITLANPQLVFETPSSSSTRSVREDILSTTDAPSVYYTASWGSPYTRPTQEPSAPSTQGTPVASQRHTTSESPSPSVSFGLEHLVPSRVSVHGRDFSPSFGLDHLLPSRIPIQHHIASPVTTERLALQEDSAQAVAQRPSRHTITRRLTEDWVQQYTTGKWRSERGNWLSDESGGSNSGSDEEEEFKTPIPFTWFSGRHRRKNTSASPLFERQQRPVSHDSFRRGHKSRESNLTLKQEDFWQFTRQLNEPDMSLFTSRWASSPQKEKPLPPPPAPPGDVRSVGNSPQKNDQLPTLPSPPNTDTQRSTPPHRPRTKLAWRGKACWIALPSVAPEACGGNKPLSASETKSRLKHFEEEGYNVNGFDLEPWTFDDSIVSQSSGQYPEDSEDVIKRQQKDFRVFVPNPQTWKSYVDDLMEQKLRALGVSLGDDLAPAQPPPMSRQSSGHYQSVSPNMMHAAMAGGSHRSTPSLAHFPTPGHSYSASVASPLSMPGDPRGHAHRHSVFGMPGMPFGFPNQQTQHNGLLAFSPSTASFNMNGLPRGGSPALERLKSEGPPSKSPISPYGMPSPFARSPQPQPGDWPGQAHLRHQSVFSSFSPQPQAQRSITPTLTPGSAMRPIPSLAEVPEDEEEPMQDYFAGATPRRQTRKEIELAHPSPRHNRNISDALEREIQGSDYHLEKSFERQLQDEEDEASNSFISQTSSNGAYVPPGKRTSLGPGLNGFGGRKDSPGFNNASTKPETKDNISNAGLAGALQNKTTNKVKGHASRLSVAAPEFKFQPGPTFQQTLPSLPGLSSFGPPIQNGIGNPSAGNMDLSSAAFQPSGLGVMPSSDFNFASSFSFNPVASVQQPIAYQAPVQSTVPSIFGDVAIPEVTKPVRRSKAVAITQPKSSPVKEEPEAEDEDGRAAQSEDRQKRARVGQNDGDAVPLFAERPASPTHSNIQGLSSVGPEKDSIVSEPQQVDDLDKKFEGDKSKPVTSKEHAAKTSANIASAQEFETMAKLPTVQNEQGHKKNSSSLSALAKPFEFKPQGSVSSNQPIESLLRSPDPNKTKPDFSPARVFSRTSEKTQASVEDLDYAPSPEPQKHAPYPTDDNEGVHFPEPTFDEIDAVMQQLNDDDEYDQVQQEFASEVVSPNASVIHHSPSRGGRDGSISPQPTLSRRQVKLRPAHINRLNRSEEVPLSEWSDDLSVDEASKLRTRSNFFDDRVDQIVGGVIDHRLAPLEKSLQMIHRAVSTIMTREPRSMPSRPLSVDDSDADDEDETIDERQPFRSVSRAQERKASQIKAAVLEALASQKASGFHLSSATEIHNALMDMNTTIARIASSNLDIDDVKHVVDESLHRMGQTLTPTVPVEDPQMTQRHKREVSELNNRLNKTLADALEEANQRRTIEEREADTRRLLRLAEEELSLLRKTVGDKEQRIHSLENQREELEIRVDAAEVTHAHDRKQLSDLEAENSALESTLEEYRLSSTKWRNEVDTVTSENEILKSSALDLKVELEESRETINLARQQLEDTIIENAALKASSAELLSQLDESQVFGKQARQAADDAAIEATAIKASAAELMVQLEEAHASTKQVQQTADDATLENTALKASVTSLITDIEESRSSAKKWKQEAEVAARDNINLQENMSDLKNQIADGLNIRENMRSKLDKIHHGMISAAEQLANEKATWQNRNEELQKRYVVLQARLEGEVSIRRSMEEEVHSLRAQAHEGVTTKIQLEQLQRSTTLHEETVRTLRENLTSEQTLSARLQRDLHESRESGRAEVQRTQMIMQSSIEAAESQANIIRASLEHEIMLAKNEIDNIKMVSDAARERHEHSLEQEADLRRDALRKVNETSSAALNDLREKHAEEIRYLKSQYERSVANAYEDKQRSAVHFNDRLELSNDQVLHLRDKVAHLEERLNVAKSAAQAAASAAQAAKSIPSAGPATASVSREEPERISPQALRESILVLQEQLQERETRIERLQTEIANVDTAAPAKLKEKEVEISWLRELLSVRNEDLNQLVDTLSKSEYDRDAVRDFAIRIRANLQMEQQEKERLINAGPSLTGQALANLTNFASPKAVSLAAAFGNWRKSRETSRPASAPKAPASRATARSSAAAARLANGRTQTPSKPALLPSPSVLSGLMTPPATNFRRTPSPAEEPSGAQHSSLGLSDGPQQANSETKMSYFDTKPSEVGEESPMVFRRQSYDEDAQLGDVDTGIGADDEEEQTNDNMNDEVENPRDQTPEELVGRSLASELEAM
ncbi:hypothetical protein QM012_004358 [Aureobasidium pullulans]|uniref:LIM zinc-binding domain-containing protein n=1 Tax=Aureobasidium pullulans TaxID=5580 RepID=A0ABR0TSW9_AURPU